MAAGATYEPIATQTLTGSTTSITFSSIPSTYTDLVIMGKVGNSTYTLNDWTELRLKFNSDSGANYSFIFMYGNGSAAGSSRSSNAGYIRAGEYAISANSNYFSSFTCSIQNYSNTSTHKTLIGRWGIPQGNGTVGLSAGVWRSTSAINSVTITSDGSWPFMTGTTLTLYGISAA